MFFFQDASSPCGVSMTRVEDQQQKAAEAPKDARGGGGGHEMFEIKFGDAVADKPPPRLHSTFKKNKKASAKGEKKVSPAPQPLAAAASKQAAQVRQKKGRGLLTSLVVGRPKEPCEKTTKGVCGRENRAGKVGGGGGGGVVSRKKSFSLRHRIETKRKKSRGKKSPSPRAASPLHSSLMLTCWLLKQLIEIWTDFYRKSNSLAFFIVKLIVGGGSLFWYLQLLRGFVSSLSPLVR